MNVERPLAPFTLTPKQQPTVWGGQRLRTTFGKDPGTDEPIGESWEVWEGDPVAYGPYAGISLGELAERYPDELLGSIPQQRSGRRFPLLTKFIDAREPLSVQVHPNDVQAQALESQPNGKTEAWHILDADPDAWIIYGVEHPVSASTLEERLRAGTADELLHKVPVKPGDTIFVPAGTIHAIGPGILLHEVQQTSDVTYRLYDWNRESRGVKRELHLDKGLQVSNLTPGHDAVISPLEWRHGRNDLALLVACPYFTLQRMRLRDPYAADTHGRTFHIVTAIDGTCRLAAGGSRAAPTGAATSAASDTAVPSAIELSAGQSAVVPACVGAYYLEPDGEATVLIEGVLDVARDIIPELEDESMIPSTIQSFLDQFATGP